MKAFRFLISSLGFLSVFALSACSGTQLVNALSKVYPANVERDLPFGSHARFKYDLYLPHTPTNTGSTTPVVVFLYGGSWNRGDKAEYEFVGRRLASLGYITAIPNYRLYPEVVYPAFLQDNAQAIAAVLEKIKEPAYQRFKPDHRIVLMGHSAGAYNAAMLAMDDRWLNEQQLERLKTIKGFIGLAGAYNIYPIEDREVRPVFSHPNYPPNSQPIDYTAQPQVPFLLLAPTQDTLVNVEKNSWALHEALSRNNNTSTLVSIEGTNHITLIGTLSPALFFKGSTVKPIQAYIEGLNK